MYDDKIVFRPSHRNTRFFVIHLTYLKATYSTVQVLPFVSGKCCKTVIVIKSEDKELIPVHFTSFTPFPVSKQFLACVTQKYNTTQMEKEIKNLM